MAAPVVHVPHAATYIPEDIFAQFGIPRADLLREARTSADLYTDRLAAQAWPGATIIAAPVSRVVVDVERYPDDDEEEMAGVGRGMIYTAAHDGQSLRRRVDPSLRAALRLRFHEAHWARLRSAAAGGVLIDLHSYPLEPWAIEPAPSAPRPEIDIGTTDGLTPEVWALAVIRHFKALDFEVGRNTPYAGVIDAGASAAIMLEIRRDVLDRPGSARWTRLVAALAAMPLAG